MKGIFSLTKYWGQYLWPVKVLGGHRPPSDARHGDQPVDSRKGWHSGHHLVEYSLHTDGEEAVAAALAGSASVGAARPAVARLAAISMETAWEPKTVQAPVWASNILQTNYKRDFASSSAVWTTWVKTQIWHGMAAKKSLVLEVLKDYLNYHFQTQLKISCIILFPLVQSKLLESRSIYIKWK